MSELKRCPFCGGRKINGTYLNWRPALMCCDCGAIMQLPMAFVGNIEAEKSNLTTWAEDMAFKIGIEKAIAIVKEEGEV